MDTKLFRRFADIVYQRSGILLRPGKESMVASRLNKRLRALKLNSYDEYLEFLTSAAGGEESVQFLDAISTNVTHFFREAHHFAILKDLLERKKAAGQKRFRLWSAACSTGEEAYSIAIVLAETLGIAEDWRVLATDISTRVLDTAHAGVFSAETLRELPPPLRAKYLKRVKGEEAERFQIIPGLRERVVFKRLNLAEPPFPMSGPLDAIFCRNVMIYFDNAVRKRLLDEMLRVLSPDGYLFVGSSESLTGLLIPMKSVSPSVYQFK